MPWCPKCKTEYINGVEECADCHTPLVSELDVDESLVWERDVEEIELSEEELGKKLREHTATYMRTEEKYKDTRSSGLMLVVLGVFGLAALALVFVGVIPLSLDPVMQYIFYGVLLVLFIVFLVMGIQSLSRSKIYKENISKEEAEEKELLEWLDSAPCRSRLDLCHSSEESPEEAYFACQEAMKKMLEEHTPQIAPERMTYIIEKAYTQMYEGDDPA